MGNPFNIGPFNCCSCPEPPDFDAETDTAMAKYINMCGCPSVAIVCESESKTATLIGFPARQEGSYGIPESIPAILYRVRERQNPRSDSDPSFNSTYTNPTSTTATYDILTGVLSRTPPILLKKYGDDSLQSTRPDGLDPLGNIGATYTETSIEYIATFPEGSTLSESRNEYLSAPDTEIDALARETATDGSSCSSINQLRTTSFSWTERTVTYTATAENLVIGVAYEGCVRLRRREAYSGTLPADADTAWEDVEPDTIAPFTPTETSEEVATDEALPFVKGWEYEVVSAHVWPVSAGCDCPTSYVAP